MKHIGLCLKIEAIFLSCISLLRWNAEGKHLLESCLSLPPSHTSLDQGSNCLLIFIPASLPVRSPLRLHLWSVLQNPVAYWLLKLFKSARVTDYEAKTRCLLASNYPRYANAIPSEAICIRSCTSAENRLVRLSSCNYWLSKTGPTCICTAAAACRFI